MKYIQNIASQEDNDFKKLVDIFIKNYIYFIISVICTISVAYVLNRYSTPAFNVSSSILIKGASAQPAGGSNTPENDFLFSNLFGRNQNFQNELWIMKSYPVIERTVRNLDLSVSYFSHGKFKYYEIYGDIPFLVSYLSDHPQPLNVILNIDFKTDSTFVISAKDKNVPFVNFVENKLLYRKKKWNFSYAGETGKLIQTNDLSIIVEPRDTLKRIDTRGSYGFKFNTINSISEAVSSKLEFTIADRQATVINISLLTESPSKGIDIVNELMNVYSNHNLERKNHIATITIDYIEKQLNEISDSLNIAEDNLQRFRSSNRLLNISDQTSGISAQYLSLQNQLAELVSRKRYFDYVSELLENENFSNLMLPASIGISDQLLNSLMTELISSQAQRENLIENSQGRNPLVQKLGIQIENLKKTISENIIALSSSTSISIDEMNKRILKIETEINRLPATQRQLGTIERKYRLNDAIYNYLMEKHAEAKITKASNLPDDIVIAPAKTMGTLPIKPNKKMNYLIALFLGFAVPYGLLLIKSILNNTIQSQHDIEQITEIPVLGNIIHNRYKTKNTIFEYPNSEIAESFRVLRTNLDFYVRGGKQKIILVTSCLENEGKSFVSLNLSMSYAQLGKRTLLIDFDLRKPSVYFKENEYTKEGLSSCLIEKSEIEDVILKSPHEKLDYILAGILPPNPAELLALEKTEEILMKLKSAYDIIVLDTTPLAQVTDAFLLIQHADTKILVTRYAHTFKNVFSIVMRDLHQKEVSNICVVLNDNRSYDDQYGYGYGYNKKKKGLFQKIIKT